MDTVIAPPGEQFLRLPGLFRRWELGQIIETGTGYMIENAGSTEDGTPVFAVYAADPASGALVSGEAGR